jgi:hypothetical protein
VVAGHRCRGRPSEVVVQNLSQPVFGYSDICKSLVKAGNRTAIHFVVLPLAAVHLDDGGLVTIGAGICAGSTECLGPVSGESLGMLRVEAVAERMPDTSSAITRRCQALARRRRPSIPPAASKTVCITT